MKHQFKQQVKHKVKRILLTTSFVVSVFASSTCLGFGEPANVNKVVLEIGNSKMAVYNLNSQIGDFKNIDSSSEVVPLIREGRTLLPLRSIVETFGGVVSWDSENNCAQININNKELRFYPNKIAFKINGKDKELLVAPGIINGRVYLPLRDFSENTGFVVNWKPVDKYNSTSKIEVIKPFIGLFPAFINDATGQKWGFIDSTGEFVIKPQYKRVNEFNIYGVALVVASDNGSSLINSKGNVLSKTVIEKENRYYYPDSENNSKLIIKGNNNSNYVYSPEGNLLLETKINIQSIYANLISYKDLKNDKEVSGFIDFKGNIVVDAIYDYVGSYQNGVYYGSLNSVNGNTNYAYFNENGFGIAAPNKNVESGIGKFSDGMITFKDAQTNLFGYKNASGQIVIGPKFKFADDFKDGYAYVTIPIGQYEEKIKIINKKGDFVMQPDAYGFATNIGNGLFTMNHFQMDLLDAKTGKSYPSKIYAAEFFDDNKICISDFDNTYFIDNNMNKIFSIPSFSGYGKITIIEDVLKVSTNKIKGYFKKDGSSIWTQPETITSLTNGIKVQHKKSWPNKGITITSPLIDGMSDKTVEAKINTTLKKMFSLPEVERSNNSVDEEYWETNDISITQDTPILNKDILTIGKNEYMYAGGAHGNGSLDYININIKTGETYTLDDLLKKDSGFEKFIADYIAKLTGRESANFSFENFDKIYRFKLGKDYLELGYPSHNYSYTIYSKIPYSKIIDFIDTKGALWNSFEKNINGIFLDEGINQEEVTTLLTNYENNFVEAVNSNRFDLLNNILTPGSSLYNSQKALITELNKKGIREKLQKFSIEEISFDENGEQIKVTVKETIGISTNGASFVDKNFVWTYKLSRNRDGVLQMYYIENAGK